MQRLAGWILCLWAVAAAAGAGAATRPSTATRPTTATPPSAAPTAAPRVFIVSELKAPLRYGDEQIGELPEGTEVLVIREAGSWLQVRVEFGDAWVTGWVSKALVQPDTLAKVGIEIGRPTLEYTYERRSLPGYKFLVVPVRFTPSKSSPSRIYFEWDDAKTADLYLKHSRDKTVLPYGFLQRQDMSDKRKFETEAKSQVVDLSGGKPVVETYVFAVPARARSFELTLKDVRRPVRLRR